MRRSEAIRGFGWTPPSHESVSRTIKFFVHRCNSSPYPPFPSVLLSVENSGKTRGQTCSPVGGTDTSDNPFVRCMRNEVYTGLPGGFKMQRVTVYKPNGETLLSTTAKRFEQTKGALILHLEGEHAEAYGATIITTLPYAIQCGHR